jgi:glycosyltransferase involved in cell wall biosynthesis
MCKTSNTEFDVTVIMPVYNEITTIESAISSVLELTKIYSLQLVVVDGCSTDGTKELLQKMKSNVNLEIIFDTAPKGKGTAVRKGLEIATGKIISIIDADNEYTINYLIEIIKFMKLNKLRFVLGNRHIAGKKMRTFTNKKITTIYYNFGHNIFTAYFNLLFNTKLKDPATMWKVFHKSDIEDYRFIGRRFEFDWELLALLIRRGHIPQEVEIEYISRSHADGKKVKSFKDPFLWVFYIVYFRFKKINI